MSATEQAQPAAEPGKKKSRFPVLIVAVLMALEGAAIFAIMRFVLNPAPAAARAEGNAEPEFDAAAAAVEGRQTAEVDVTECRPSNSMSGRLINFKLRVSALVMKADAEKAAEIIQANQSRITDRVIFVIRSAEPVHLAEPGLETIKRRMKREVDAILGDEHLVQELLIPEIIQSTPGL